MSDISEIVGTLRMHRTSTADAMILHAADNLERLQRELNAAQLHAKTLNKLLGEAETSEEKYKTALLEIRQSHTPDQPASSGADEVSWVMQHVGRLRKIAADALDSRIQSS